MKYLLIVAAFVAVSSAAVVPEDKGLLSSVSSGISSVASGVSSASALASPLTGSSTNCQQKPVNITALQNILPPAMAGLVTEKNVETLQGVGKLAGLSTAAATGNPIAIVKLLFFLTSAESPVDDLFEMGKEILPHLSPSEIAANLPTDNSVSNAFNTAAGAVSNQFHNLQDQVGQVFNKKPAVTTDA